MSGSSSSRRCSKRRSLSCRARRSSTRSTPTSRSTRRPFSRRLRGRRGRAPFCSISASCADARAPTISRSRWRIGSAREEPRADDAGEGGARKLHAPGYDAGRSSCRSTLPRRRRSTPRSSSRSCKRSARPTSSPRHAADPSVRRDGEVTNGLDVARQDARRVSARCVRRRRRSKLSRAEGPARDVRRSKPANTDAAGWHQRCTGSATPRRTRRNRSRGAMNQRSMSRFASTSWSPSRARRASEGAFFEAGTTTGVTGGNRGRNQRDHHDLEWRSCDLRSTVRRLRDGVLQRPRRMHGEL